MDNVYVNKKKYFTSVIYDINKRRNSCPNWLEELTSFYYNLYTLALENDNDKISELTNPISDKNQRRSSMSMIYSDLENTIKPLSNLGSSTETLFNEREICLDGVLEYKSHLSDVDPSTPSRISMCKSDSFSPFDSLDQTPFDNSFCQIYDSPDVIETDFDKFIKTNRQTRQTMAELHMSCDFSDDLLLELNPDSHVNNQLDTELSDNINDNPSHIKDFIKKIMTKYSVRELSHFSGIKYDQMDNQYDANHVYSLQGIPFNSETATPVMTRPFIPVPPPLPPPETNKKEIKNINTIIKENKSNKPNKRFRFQDKFETTQDAINQELNRLFEKSRNTHTSVFSLRNK